jgi:hypothetical protein
VSVSTTDGKPATGLAASNFAISDMASLNHAFPSLRTINKLSEGPDGFYIIQLNGNPAQPTLPPGHYVFAVVVSRTISRGRGLKRVNNGQTVAVGDLPG